MRDGLTEGQRRVLEAVARSPLATDIYFTGGTALSAAYLHHRRSLDVDLFSRQKIDTLAVIKVLEGVADTLSPPHRVHDRVEFTVHVAGEQVRVEFVHYAHDRIAPATTSLCGLEVDSLRDMLANKLSAIIDRTEPKDFADILLLLRRPDLSMDQGMDDCQKKFGWPGIKYVVQQALMRGTRLTAWPDLDPPITLDDAKVELRALAASLIRLED